MHLFRMNQNLYRCILYVCKYQTVTFDLFMLLKRVHINILTTRMTLNNNTLY